MAKKATKAPYITAPEIKEFLDLEDRRRALNRQAEDLEKQAKPLKEKLLEFVRIEGGKAKSVERSGFVLAIKMVKSSPSWKPEFIRVAGQEEADKLIAEAPPREQLSVERMG